MLKKILSLCLILLISLVSSAQKKITSDDLLKAAQKSAFQQKDYNAAKKMLQAALKRQPDYSDVRILLGRIYTWTNNYDSARIAFEYVLKRHPEIEDAAVAYSDLNVYNNNFSQAINIIDNGLKYHPKSETLLIKKAKIEGAIKDYAAADLTLQQLFNINPKNLQADSLRYQFQKEANAATLPPVPTADELLVAAKDAAFNQKDYSKAKQLLLQALDKSPEYHDVRIFLGRIYTWTGVPDSARMAFQYVLQKKPDLEDASLAYSDLETYNNQYSQALSIVESGLAYHPSSEILLLKKARILAATKDYAGADKVAVQVLSLNRNNQTADSLHTSFRNALANPYKQNSAGADELFKAARTAAFDQKNYPLARQLVLQLLEKSPDYSEARVFLGRLYTWSNMPDSARIHFQYILQKTPGYEDASVAYSDVESINKNYKRALTIVDTALTFHPNSENLLLKKAHILQNLKEYKLANVALEQLLSINPNNTAARALQNAYKTELYDNRLGLGYNFTGFDKQFSQPWHLLSFDYGRVTKLGSITGRINYGNRFGLNAFQFEADAYPHISNTFYAYINLGFSGTNNVFPRTRGGFSLYANLPSAFEGELGFRYLQFSGDPVWIYTAYLGKYYQKWLFGARTYITPSKSKRTPSVSYSLTGTYFIGGKYDQVGGVIGYGLSPDDRNNIVQYNTDVQLKTFRMGIFYKKTISKQNAITADLNWLSQEYLPKTKGNQYQIGVSWLHFF